MHKQHILLNTEVETLSLLPKAFLNLTSQQLLCWEGKAPELVINNRLGGLQMIVLGSVANDRLSLHDL